MRKCIRYSRYCFECENSFSNYHLLFGRLLAINCPYQNGMLSIQLTQEQIRKMTKGRLEKISKEAVVEGVISVKGVSDYLIKNKEGIVLKIIQSK